MHDGIVYLGGRIARAAGTPDGRLIILPTRSKVTDLIIAHYHEVEGHMGASHVLASVRDVFWIVKGMSAVRKVLNRCLRCRELTAKPCQQVISPLPDFRTQIGLPFRYCGVDYFGPFLVKIGRSNHKRYGCLFTCLQIRAVHLEVVHSMSTDSFMMALTRFVSRRGPPEVMFSDNGSNFVGASNELRRVLQSLDDNGISDRLLRYNIEWRFNPPGSSHRGGAWERMIRTVRRVLSSVTSQQVLTEEALLTYMVEVEGIVNNRPLIPVYDDPLSPSVIRPNDLLRMKSNPDLCDEVTLRERYTLGWRQAQHLGSVFWKRWRTEDLPCLQKLLKWTQSTRSVMVGDLVLLLGESTPRGLWRKGVVVEIFPGPDGHVRHVRLHTSNGNVMRDIRSLRLLEGVVS